MALEEYLEPEIAVTAAVFSPKVRRLFRRGLVYGVAGVLTVGDRLISLSPGVSQSIREAMTSAERAARRTMAQAQAGFSAAVEKDAPDKPVQASPHNDGTDQAILPTQGQSS